MSSIISNDKETKPTCGKMLVAFILVVITYLSAFSLAWSLIKLLPAMHILLITLIADIGATIIVFIFSVVFNNVSFYDPYWSIQPIAIAVYWMLLGWGKANPIRQIIVVSIVSFWGIRLTLNWARGWKGLKHEDWRYVKYREEQPKLFWLIAFTGLEMMPTLFVYLGCLSLYPALISSNASFNFLDGIGIFIAFGATLIEFIADEQMKIFAKMNDDPKRVMNLGLWSVSRHPNYFGEVSFWWGLFFFALSSTIYSITTPLWWISVSLSGPLAILLLFLFISIPLIENRQKKKRPAYAAYQKQVSKFIPWFPRRK